MEPAPTMLKAAKKRGRPRKNPDAPPKAALPKKPPVKRARKATAGKTVARKVNEPKPNIHQEAPNATSLPEPETNRIPLVRTSQIRGPALATIVEEHNEEFREEETSHIEELFDLTLLDQPEKRKETTTRDLGADVLPQIDTPLSLKGDEVKDNYKMQPQVKDVQATIGDPIGPQLGKLDQLVRGKGTFTTMLKDRTSGSSVMPAPPTETMRSDPGLGGPTFLRRAVQGLNQSVMVDSNPNT